MVRTVPRLVSTLNRPPPARSGPEAPAAAPPYPLEIFRVPSPSSPAHHHPGSAAVGGNRGRLNADDGRRGGPRLRPLASELPAAARRSGRSSQRHTDTIDHGTFGGPVELESASGHLDHGGPVIDHDIAEHHDIGADQRSDLNVHLGAHLDNDRPSHHIHDEAPPNHHHHDTAHHGATHHGATHHGAYHHGAYHRTAEDPTVATGYPTDAPQPPNHGGDDANDSPPDAEPPSSSRTAGTATNPGRPARRAEHR
ncbi:MAG: hypothetical protein M3063_13560 [Actinomycetota bacterium]|nr:hypothetical protein [Actinomycetota bacterium]